VAFIYPTQTVSSTKRNPSLHHILPTSMSPNAGTIFVCLEHSVNI